MSARYPGKVQAPSRAEAKSLTRLLAALRRSVKPFSSAETALKPWPSRLEGHPRAASPKRLTDAAKKAAGALAKIRLLFLPYSSKLSSALAHLDSAETALLEFGSGIALVGRFGKRRGPKLRCVDAKEIVEDTLQALDRCRAEADRVGAKARQYLLGLEQTKQQRRQQRQQEGSPAEANSVLETFFTQIQGRGWKVQQQQAERAAAPDLLERSHAEVELLRESSEELLDPDTPIGICKLPIVLIRDTKLSDTVKRELAARKLTLRKVYGSYLAINGLYLMGIHRDLMAVEDVDTQPRQKGEAPTPDLYSHAPRCNGLKLDLAKFGALLPAVCKGRSDICVADVAPLGTPVKVGQHYYLPLLPRFLAHRPSFSLGEWQPLTSTQPHS